MIKIHDKIGYLRTLVLAAGALVALLIVGSFTSPGTMPALAVGSCPITLKADGSTTVQAVSEAVEAPFEASRPGTDVQFGFIGSGNGINEVLAHTNDIAPSSRALNAGAETTNLWPFLIGHDAFVMAIQDSPELAGVTNITAAQVKGIYEGTITNWNQIPGGPDHAIVPRARITGSGSQPDFLGKFAIVSSSEAATIAATGLPRLTESVDMAQAAAANNYQIAYTGLPFMTTPGMRALPLEGVLPSISSIRSLTYPIQGRRDLYLMDPKTSFNSRFDSSPTVLADDLVNYYLSTAGQALVENVGDVSITAPAQQPIPDWDVNLNGAVSLSDLGAITSKWGQSSSCNGWIRADVNNNKAVSLSDIGGVTSHWGGAGFVPPS